MSACDAAYYAVFAALKHDLSPAGDHAELLMPRAVVLRGPVPALLRAGLLPG